MDSHTVELLEFNRIKSDLSSLCLSDEGRERLNNQTFLEKKSELGYFHDLVSALRELFDSNIRLTDTFFPPLTEIIAILSTKGIVLESMQLHDISLFCESARKIKTVLLANISEVEGATETDKKRFEMLRTVINEIHPLSDLVKEIRRVIDKDGLIKENLPELKQARDNIKSINKNLKTKSGFMIGIGENKDQILETMNDLRDVNVDFLTIGQYLQPTRSHAEIKKYYTPREFVKLQRIGLKIGFKHVESGPLVRSSYHAERAIC
jgi:lipoic acid synthetase